MKLARSTTITRLVVQVAPALVAAVTVALAATGSAAAVDGPVEGAAGGCALQCVEKALVTSTASSAKVAIVTSVPTRIVMTVRGLSSAGRVDGPAITSTSPLQSTSRTLYVYGLQPEKSYSIRVAATDASGHTASRSGKFATRRVQTAVDPGAGGFSSGLGCSAKCITKAVPVHVGPTAALFEVATNTAATITMTVSRSGSTVSTSTSPSKTTRYTHAASPLDPGTRYDLKVRATDSSGRAEQHQFAFTTVERKARITFWQIKVLDDGDAGPDRGELSFQFWLGQKQIDDGVGFHKRSSGDLFDVHPLGTSRQGITAVIPANGANPALDIRVDGEECDGPLFMSNCVSEVVDQVPAGGGKNSSGYDHATAGGAFALNTLLAQSALPGNSGTTLPSGHSAYVVFETTQHHVKFRVYAYLDYFYAW